MRDHEAYRHCASQPDFRCENTGDVRPSWVGAASLVHAMFCASTALYLRPLKLDRCFGTANGDTESSETPRYLRNIEFVGHSWVKHSGNGNTPEPGSGFSRFSHEVQPAVALLGHDEDNDNNKKAEEELQ